MIIVVALLCAPFLLNRFPIIRDCSSLVRSMLCFVFAGAMFFIVILGWNGVSYLAGVLRKEKRE